MKIYGLFVYVTLLVLMLACAGCATSPEAQQRTRAAEEEVESILSQPLDASEYGETKRCLAGSEYRDFRVLDDQHIFFEGRRGKLWLNTLRMRCPDLRFAKVLRVKSIYSYGRICDMDSFQPGDWFDWPWYRRWPWSWGNRWGTGMTCTLGKFQPVTETQVEAIEAALKR
jgi:hypothetical protein